MNKLSISHDAFVRVGGGRKALFLRNAGDEKFPNLLTERVFVDEIPLTHELGSDQPVRALMAANSSSRSALETTDWHGIEERRFVQQVTSLCRASCESGACGSWSSQRRRARWPTCEFRFTRMFEPTPCSRNG